MFEIHSDVVPNGVFVCGIAFVMSLYGVAVGIFMPVTFIILYYRHQVEILSLDAVYMENAVRFNDRITRFVLGINVNAGVFYFNIYGIGKQGEHKQKQQRQESGHDGFKILILRELCNMFAKVAKIII